MENINITPIVEAGILLIAAIISVFVVPWIKSKAKNEDTTNFLRWVEIAVAAAEQLYESTDGAAKKNYVLAYLQGKGITVNAIAPGVILTEMNKALSEEDLSALAEETPLCRIGNPEEIARSIYFLASEEASFITGDVLNASGGFVI